MFRFVLSWRYLARRRTNLIAIVGLLLAVGALIMILSIMTGFLEESRRILRGSLSDVVVEALPFANPDGTRPSRDPAYLLRVLRSDPRVQAATPRLVHNGIVPRTGHAGRGGHAEGPVGILVRTGTATLAGAQLVGVEVRTAERIAASTLAAWARLRGAALDPRVDDELVASNLLDALAREPRDGVRVPEPLLPFRPLPGRRGAAASGSGGDGAGGTDAGGSGAREDGTDGGATGAPPGRTGAPEDGDGRRRPRAAGEPGATGATGATGTSGTAGTTGDEKDPGSGRPFDRTGPGGAAKRGRGAPPPSAVVGEQLFAALALEQGETIEFITARHAPDGSVEQRRARLVVAGTFRSGQNDADLSRIFLDRRALADLVGDEQLFTQVVVDLVDYERDASGFVADMRAELAKRGLIFGLPPDVPSRYQEVKTWEDYRGVLLPAIENQRALMAILLSLVLVVAGFTVFAILSMMVNEKRRDVGVLQALGATPGGLVSLFLLIAVWDVLLGATAGAALGTWAALRIDDLERWVSDLLGVQIINRDLYHFDTIPSQVEPETVAAILGFTLLATLLSALIPAWRAARVDPLQGVRQE